MRRFVTAFLPGAFGDLRATLGRRRRGSRARLIRRPRRLSWIDGLDPPGAADPLSVGVPRLREKRFDADEPRPLRPEEELADSRRLTPAGTDRSRRALTAGRVIFRFGYAGLLCRSPALGGLEDSVMGSGIVKELGMSK